MTDSRIGDDTRSGIIATLGILLAGVPAVSAGADAPALKSFQVVRIMESQAPRIDGKLDEAAWQEAARIEDLRQFQPNENSDPSERTQFYVMYDKDALYVGARLWQLPEHTTANILRQGEEVTSEDRISIILDTFNDKRNGYRFEVNPNSIREDALFIDTTQVQRDWDGIYFAQATRDAEGWTAEMAIPFKTLSFNPAIDTWGINFHRAIADRNERQGWVFRNRNQNPSSSGVMTGITGLDQGRGLDVIPGLTFREEHDHVAGTSEFKTEPSLDAYYKVTSALNAALTFNTDFSATEVDDRQVNLTRFNLFFPEKRSFFLRDAEIFEFGRLKGGNITGIVNNTFGRPGQENGRPFFSRSIGLGSSGQPVDIIAGTKLSGRIGNTWNLGALAIRQDETDTVDARNLFVGRVAANVLDESSLGAIVTSGDPRSNLDNTVVGADFRYLNSRIPGNRTLEGELWYQQSDTEGVVGDDAAYGIRLRSPNNTGWRGGFGLKELEANFNPALGYVNRRGVRDYTGELGYMNRWRQGYIQAAYTGLDFQQFDRIDGGLQSRLATFRLGEIYSRVGDGLSFRHYRNTEVLRAPFEISEGVLLPAEEYAFNEYEVSINSADFRTIAVELGYRIGDFYSGDRTRLSGEIVWKPSPHFWFTGNFEYNDVELPEGDFIVRLLSTRFDLMFTPTLSWVNLIQYDNVSDTVAAHSRVRWIPQAGREMYIVYNHNMLDENADGSFRSRRADGAVKLNYTFRF